MDESYRSRADESYIEVYTEDDKERFHLLLTLRGIPFEGNGCYCHEGTAIQVAKNLAKELGIEYHD